MNPTRQLLFVSTLLASLLLGSCASLHLSNDLSKVKFSLDRISSVQVAGIDLMHIDSLDELNMFQMARATLAVSRNSLPLDLTLHLKSENPLANKIAATLTRLDWTLILDGRDTISGTLEDDITLSAGNAQDIPLRLSMNMLEFFNEKNAMDLLDMALAFGAEDGAIPPGLALKIRPTIDTPFGPITYGKSFIIEAAKDHLPSSESRVF
ncbi:MAG: hypothetical protein ACE5E3_03915 [Mariprofundus sp.]